ncbi:MAG: STAS domain-containing protein [Fibrobacteria bacterium]|nr:STAS domain-containing protein [Fibrobacteria bacterium]
MEFPIRAINSWYLLQLPPVINFEVNLALKNKIEELSELDCPKIAFDVSDLSYMGSLAVGVFVFAHKLLAEHNGDFCLFSPNEVGKKIMNETGLDNVLNLITDLSELD